MRKNIGYAISWALYWVGDLVSRVMHVDFMWWLYPVYNRSMLWSSQVQDWAGNDTPWIRNAYTKSRQNA
jgi:hypothetical protein